jgi:hypothetical protein
VWGERLQQSTFYYHHTGITVIENGDDRGAFPQEVQECRIHLGHGAGVKKLSLDPTMMVLITTGT